MGNRTNFILYVYKHLFLLQYQFGAEVGFKSREGVFMDLGLYIGSIGASGKVKVALENLLKRLFPSIETVAVSYKVSTSKVTVSSSGAVRSPGSLLTGARLLDKASKLATEAFSGNSNSKKAVCYVTSTANSTSGVGLCYEWNGRTYSIGVSVMGSGEYFMFTAKQLAAVIATLTTPNSSLVRTIQDRNEVFGTKGEKLSLQKVPVRGMAGYRFGVEDGLSAQYFRKNKEFGSEWGAYLLCNLGNPLVNYLCTSKYFDPDFLFEEDEKRNLTNGYLLSEYPHERWKAEKAAGLHDERKYNFVRWGTAVQVGKLDYQLSLVV